MIEQFLQTALEFIKEIWFQLDSQFGLEKTEAFAFLKPYLLQLQENPLYMGVSLAALFLVPYGLIKIKSIAKERERKLDELIEEMEDEEDYDEDDPRRLRRPEPDDDTAKPLFAEEEAPPSYTKVLDEGDSDNNIEEMELEAEFEEFESSDNAETVDPEEIVEPVSSQLTESEFDKDLNEFMSDEFTLEKEETDPISEFSLDDSTHDQAIKELQEEGELIELDESLPDEGLSGEGLSDADEGLPAEDPFANYSELDDDEQDKAIKDLQDEMERTISQLTQQIEEPHEPPPSAIKDLNEIHIGGDATIDDDYEYSLEEPTQSPDIQNDPPSDAPELSDSEILASLEPELKTDNPEATPEESPDYETALSSSSESFTFEPEPGSPTLDSAPEISTGDFSFEPEPTEEEPLFAKYSAPEAIPDPDEEPLFAERSTIPEPDEEPLFAEHSAPEKTDSLIERLKFLQTRFENRYQPGSPTPIAKKTPDYAAASESLVEPRRYTSTPSGVPQDDKKYMNLLESFIFMKDQKKHK